MTQKDFAKLIGVAHVTVTLIENGALGVSRELSLRIYASTGVDPESIRTQAMPKKGKEESAASYLRKRTAYMRKVSHMEPMGIAGGQFDAETFKLHHAVADLPTANLAMIMTAQNRLDVVLTAALATKQSNAVLMSFYCWLENAVKLHGLEAEARMATAHRTPLKDRMRQALHGNRKLSHEAEVDLERIFQGFAARVQEADDNGSQSWPDDMTRSWARDHAALTQILHRQIEEANCIPPPVPPASG